MGFWCYNPSWQKIIAKLDAGWNANIHAYYNFMCDKHTYSTPTPDCQLNGSLKGFDAYAAGNGFSYQEPLQSFSLLDSRRGVTIKSKIFCE